jgi:hypothetical protein
MADRKSVNKPLLVSVFTALAAPTATMAASAATLQQ